MKSNDDGYWAYTESVIDAVIDLLDDDAFPAKFKQFPQWKGDLAAAHLVLIELGNGGLCQFFLNSTGIVAPEALAAFRRIGLPVIADTLEEAMRSFGPDYPRERDTRNALLAAKTGHSPDDPKWDPYTHGYFKELDPRLFGGRDFDQFYDALDAYAKANAAS